jgi:hypothetical protein
MRKMNEKKNQFVIYSWKVDWRNVLSYCDKKFHGGKFCHCCRETILLFNV